MCPHFSVICAGYCCLHLGFWQWFLVIHIVVAAPLKTKFYNVKSSIEAQIAVCPDDESWQHIVPDYSSSVLLVVPLQWTGVLIITQSPRSILLIGRSGWLAWWFGQVVLGGCGRAGNSASIAGWSCPVHSGAQVSHRCHCVCTSNYCKP